MTAHVTQLNLPFSPATPDGLPKEEKTRSNGQANRLDVEDKAFHDWYRFVLSFPPHLVRDYLQKFGLDEHSMVLDPFCGTGTTLVEARRNGVPSIGVEANPFAHFASATKVDWEIDAGRFSARAQEIADATLAFLHEQGIEDNQIFEAQSEDFPLRSLEPEAASLLLTNSISPLPLHKTLVLLDEIKKFQGEREYKHFLLALANALVYKIGNLHFGPEVGVGKIKANVPVVACWLSEVENMARDLSSVSGRAHPDSRAMLADARRIGAILERSSVDGVITSPPYPNEKDYTRTTRLESVLLGFIHNKAELRQFKKGLVRSNTRGIYKEDDDDRWVAEHPEIQRIAASIEARRQELGKTSGFERMYGRVTKLYFGGMARHLDDLRNVLRPGAQLAYVVGDQASYLRVMIRTGELLADIAQALGYELVQVDLFRTRFATATKEQLREEVVVLRWPGGEKH